jgi:hypothetical protein
MPTFGKELFIQGLKELGHEPEEDRGDNRVVFKYGIAAGRFQGQTIFVGIEVPTDFNVTCPTGPHISPRLIPINPNGAGNDRAAESPNFGLDWEYLSRPFRDQREGWNRTSRDVKAYMRHVKHILETL